MPPTLLQSTCFNGLMMNLNIAGSRVVRGMEGFFFFDFFIRRNNITRDFYVREYIFGITVYNIVSFAASYPVLGLVKIIFFFVTYIILSTRWKFWNPSEVYPRSAAVARPRSVQVQLSRIVAKKKWSKLLLFFFAYHFNPFWKRQSRPRDN